MAGGMAKKGTALPAWLVAANAETRAAAEESMRLRRPERNPFVWVVGSDADYPGIVVDRRRVGAGWQILVAYVSPRWDMVVQWLDAAQLQPARAMTESDGASWRGQAPVAVAPLDSQGAADGR